MMPLSFIACRSVSNFDGSPRPTGDVTRECRVCSEPVSLTERGQEQEKAGGVVLCNPCTLILAAKVKSQGNQLKLHHNPEAVKMLHTSEAARRMHELFEGIFKP